MNVKEIVLDEFGNCVQLNNDDIQVTVTLDYGPRIVSVRKNEGIQFVYNGKDPAIDRPCGHKMRITFDKSTNGIYCDNSPVRYSPMGSGVRFVQTVTEPVQMEAIMDVYFSENGDLTVEHSIFNKSKEALKLSIYTETPFNKDGFVFITQGSAVSPERPGRIMTLWDGCKWSDERLYVGDDFVTVKSVDGEEKPRLKIGINDTKGVAGYICGSAGLIKRYTHNPTALYPFYNCSAFATENSGYLSVQMTSPFYLVEPDEAVRHIEIWNIKDSCNIITEQNESGIRTFLE